MQCANAVSVSKMLISKTVEKPFSVKKLLKGIHKPSIANYLGRFFQQDGITEHVINEIRETNVCFRPFFTDAPESEPVH